MKYLKIIFTLIFVAAGAAVYFSNREFMHAPVTIGFESVPFYHIAPVFTTAGAVLAATFLLGMIFALGHSSLNWIELIGKNRKINKLEKEAEAEKAKESDTES